MLSEIIEIYGPEYIVCEKNMGPNMALNFKSHKTPSRKGNWIDVFEATIIFTLDIYNPT
jgi:hypothetical protein